jgi:hypothetical protein
MIHKAILSESAGDAADQEFNCLVLKCRLDNEDDQTSIETAMRKLLTTMFDLMSGKLHVVASLASFLTRSSQMIQCLLVEYL